jgi:molecular chaperone DnaK (HSP70)
MPDKNEIERRKQIKKELREKAKLEFENSLPISREKFNQLFDFLDKKLGEYDCDDSLKLTFEFFKENETENISEIENWLKENGGYCDCEVLNNVEEIFDQDAIL